MTESIVKLESKYMNLVLLVISSWTFFSYLLPGNFTNFILLITIIGLVFYIAINHKRIILTSNQVLLILISFSIIFVQIISLFYSEYIESTFYRSFLIISIFIIGMLLVAAQGSWQKKAIRYLLFLSVLHALLTLFSFIFPMGFNTLVLSILPNHIKTEIDWFMSNGFYPGITNQISINAFYISVGISIIFCSIITKCTKNTKTQIVLIILLFIALLLTGKRGHLIANIISMIFIVGMYSKIQGKSFLGKTIKGIISISALLFIVIMFFPEAAAPITRFIEKQGEDITSGRIDLYINALVLFMEKPIFGWGTGTFSNLHGTGNHNIIFQLLSENGIIGLITFLLLLSFNLIYTNKQLIINYSNGNRAYDKFYLFSFYMQIFFITYGLSGNVLNDEYILMVYIIAIAIPYNLFKLNNRKLLSDHYYLTDNNKI